MNISDRVIAFHRTVTAMSRRDCAMGSFDHFLAPQNLNTLFDMGWSYVAINISGLILVKKCFALSLKSQDQSLWEDGPVITKRARQN